MTQLVTKRTSCRLCESKQLQLVLPMKPSPIADAFIMPDQKAIEQPLIPLDLYQCQSCGHAQNVDVVNPEALFRDYIFTTGSSNLLVKHFDQYATSVTDKLHLSPTGFVVEIGSNDGTLLKNFKKQGMQVLGIDPALDIAKQATDQGIPTLSEFFSLELAKQILLEQGAAKLVVANNVYAHSDQLADITQGISHLLDHDGVFVFEVSYLLDIIDNFVFDTIYHEHLSYHSITPFVPFFNQYGLELFDVEKVITKGGSMRCFVQKLNGPRCKSPILNQMVLEESRRKLHEPQIFEDYAQKIAERKGELHAYLSTALQSGKTIAGYGASTTVTTLMYHFELENKLSYLIDDNTKKHGLLSPGCHLEVKPSSVLYELKPDIVVILAWQYAAPILQKHERFVENQGIFVIPLPELKIVGHCIAQKGSS